MVELNGAQQNSWCGKLPWVAAQGCIARRMLTLLRLCSFFDNFALAGYTAMQVASTTVAVELT
jgi:hypothetical protein